MIWCLRMLAWVHQVDAIQRRPLANTSNIHWTIEMRECSGRQTQKLQQRRFNHLPTIILPHYRHKFITALNSIRNWRSTYCLKTHKLVSGFSFQLKRTRLSHDFCWNNTEASACLNLSKFIILFLAKRNNFRHIFTFQLKRDSFDVRNYFMVFIQYNRPRPSIMLLCPQKIFFANQNWCCVNLNWMSLKYWLMEQFQLTVTITICTHQNSKCDHSWRGQTHIFKLD